MWLFNLHVAPPFISTQRVGTFIDKTIIMCLHCKNHFRFRPSQKSHDSSVTTPHIQQWADTFLKRYLKSTT